jgi:hypothetical protein
MTQKDGGNSTKPIGPVEKVSLMACVLGLLLAYQLNTVLQAFDIATVTRVGIITLYDFFLAVAVMAVGLVSLFHLLNMVVPPETVVDDKVTDEDDEPEDTFKMSEGAWQSLVWLAKVLAYAFGMPCLAALFWLITENTGGRGFGQWNLFAAALFSYVNGWFVVKATVWFFRLRHPKQKEPDSENPS